MLDLLKNAIAIGVGIAAMTQEKVEEVSKNISKEVKMTEAEGQKIFAEFLDHVKHSSNNLEARIKRTVTQTLASMQITTHDDIKKADYATCDMLNTANNATSEEINKLRSQIEELKKIITEKQN